jgi:hypothetical protein
VLVSRCVDQRIGTTTRSSIRDSIIFTSSFLPLALETSSAPFGSDGVGVEPSRSLSPARSGAGSQWRQSVQNVGNSRFELVEISIGCVGGVGEQRR